MNRKKLLTLRTIFIILTLSVMVTIFVLSADNADESNAKSDILADSFVYSVLSLFNLSDEEIQQVIDVSVFIVRKTAHFAEYAVLGFLTACVCTSFYLKTKQTLLISSATGILYAISDEIHQYFVPGRACQIRDVLIDSSGVISGIVFLFIILFMYRYIQKKKMAT